MFDKTVVEAYITKYPEIVELGNECAWVRNADGEGHDIAIDLATELGLHIKEFRVSAGHNGWQKLWGYIVQ